MKVSTNDKALASQVKRLDQQKKNLILVKEGELQNLKKFYDGKAKEVQSNGVEQIYTAKDRAEKDLLETIQREEARLQEYRSKMKNAQGLLEKNKNELLTQRKEHLQDIHMQLEENAHEEYLKGQDYIKDISRKNRNFISALDRSTTTKQQLLRGEARARIQSESTRNDLQIKKHEDRLRKQRQIRDLEFAKAVAAEKMAHNRYLKTLYSRNEMKKAHQAKVGKELLNENQKFYDRQIQQQEVMFKQKMSAMIKQHEELYKRIKDRLTTEIEQTKASLVKEKELIETRAKDDFYAIKEIAPQVTDFGNEYVVAVETPVHEKEDFVFSAHGRRMKLSLTRRFNQRVENEDGGFNRSRRSEVITKEFKVDDILDPSTIERKFENGILMFKIAKL